MDGLTLMAKTEVSFKIISREYNLFLSIVNYISCLVSDPIDCSAESICHLAWLRRYKVNDKFWLKCSNGTSFKDLQPAGFNHCP